MDQRTRLRGGLPCTVTWVSFDEDGTLVVEFFDHSPESDQCFGNDVAFILRVASDERQRLAKALVVRQESNGEERESAILEALSARFGSYFEVRTWLDDIGIRYGTQFDPWA